MDKVETLPMTEQVPQTDMIERVARAICCPDGCDGDTGSGKPCDIRREDSTSMTQARAAIEAMREPTPEMRINGGIAWVNALPDSETYVDTADACWKAMINEALK